jgi:hypothetical protein
VQCPTSDEMSVRQNIHFSHIFGCIEGFEDLGTHSRTTNTAIHALVFMLCGLHKKCKQAVARLIQRSNKDEMLVNFVMEVLIPATM